MIKNKIINRRFTPSKVEGKGFTLVELLVVIGIIAILFAVVLVAINPARRFAEANNARRLSDVNSILNAVLNYSVDNKGSLPSKLKVDSSTTSPNRAAQAPRFIGTQTTALTISTGNCKGITTCSNIPWQQCSTDAGCNNACNASNKCGVTGNTCTGAGTPPNGAAFECGGDGASVGAGACVANVCDTASPFTGKACTGPSDCQITACNTTTHICPDGPFKGYYCNADADCTRNFASAPAAGVCQSDTINSQYLYDLGADGLVTQYLASVPKDPGSTASAANTLYAIENVTGTGRVKVTSCTPEDPTGDGYTDNLISVTR